MKQTPASFLITVVTVPWMQNRFLLLVTQTETVPVLSWPRFHPKCGLASLLVLVFPLVSHQVSLSLTALLKLQHLPSDCIQDFISTFICICTYPNIYIFHVALEPFKSLSSYSWTLDNCSTKSALDLSHVCMARFAEVRLHVYWLLVCQ